MSYVNPRITLTVEQELYDTLARLARLQKKPLTKIITGLLGDVQPSLRTMADSLEAAQRTSADARANFVRTVQLAEEEIRPLADFSRNQIDMFSGSTETSNE